MPTLPEFADWLLVPIAYLVGSVQWGLYVVMLTKRVDIRTLGSGKTGTTNVLRASGKGAAVMVLLADAAKGFGVVALARAISDDPVLHALVGTGVIAGHIWPVLAGFKGGRGIATGLGTIAAFGAIPPLIGLGVFIPVVAITRYVSLGSVLAVSGVIVLYGVKALFLDAPVAYFLYTFSAGGLIIFMHRDNIKRLIAGTERRLGKPVA
jgi:acyl phosphate:glycerol-3-phosphate acyltransferase